MIAGSTSKLEISNISIVFPLSEVSQGYGN
jgi:hypothetical protein